MTRGRAGCGGPLRWVLTTWAALAGCAPAVVGPDKEPLDCTVDGKLERVEGLMHGIYLWAEDSPRIDRLGFVDPTEYIVALRYDALDRWSYATDLSEADDWFDEGAYVGGGYSLKTDPDGVVRFAQVFADNPAADAGLARGDALLAISGQPLETLTTPAAWDAAVGPIEAGNTVEFTVQGPSDAEPWVASVVLAEVVVPPVVGVEVRRVGDRTVGVLQLTGFIEPAHAALDAAFSTFQDAQIDALVVDLRYNGGGLLAVARHLAGLVLPDHEGEVFQHYWHNAAHSDENTATLLEFYDNAVQVDDVVVFTTGSTASASEMLAFNLMPYVPVHLVGQTTSGKPVTMKHYEACDIFMAPVATQAGNRDARATWFDGLAPDCTAEDRLTAAMRSDADPMWQHAEALLSTGGCLDESPLPAPGEPSRPQGSAEAGHPELQVQEAVVWRPWERRRWEQVRGAW